MYSSFSQHLVHYVGTAVQQELEGITEELRVPGSKPIGPVQRVSSV